MAKLSDDELQAAVARLPGWAVADGALVKRFTFPTFPEGVYFVDRVADAAEEAGHHPDIDIRYNAITMRLSTHDEGGVTEKDIALAEQIDAQV